MAERVRVSVRVAVAMSRERSACLGAWVLLLLGAGLEEALLAEGCSCNPAHPQQLFCSAEIGEWKRVALVQVTVCR